MGKRGGVCNSLQISCHPGVDWNAGWGVDPSDTLNKVKKNPSEVFQVPVFAT